MHQPFSRVQTDLEKSIGKRTVYRPSDWSMAVPERYPHAGGNGGGDSAGGISRGVQDLFLAASACSSLDRTTFEQEHGEPLAMGAVCEEEEDPMEHQLNQDVSNVDAMVKIITQNYCEGVT